jgi:hypothetical protein
MAFLPDLTPYSVTIQGYCFGTINELTLHKSINIAIMSRQFQEVLRYRP